MTSVTSLIRFPMPLKLELEQMIYIIALIHPAWLCSDQRGWWLQEALCLTLFPCCTTVAAAASSAIMKGHWSAGPSLVPATFTPVSPSLWTRHHPSMVAPHFSDPSSTCHQDNSLNKGHVKARSCVCVLFQTYHQHRKMSSCRSVAGERSDFISCWIAS